MKVTGYLEKDFIRQINSDIAKRSVIISGCAIVAAASLYGVINITQELIEYCNMETALTLNNKIAISLEGALSSTTMFFSGAGIIHHGNNIKQGIQRKKQYKKEL